MPTSGPAAVQAGTPRDRRRIQTREEILAAALAVMAEQGAAALNLTEVARRVGLRQPSLYQYFDSRNAVYDALFESGMRTHLAVVTEASERSVGGWDAVRAVVTATLRFAVDNPVLAQLLFTRSVPGFAPSAQAYAPSLDTQEVVRAAVASAVRAGDLHPAAATLNGLALLIALIAGIGSQQAANDSEAGFDEGRFVALLAPALDMYAAYFAPDRPAGWNPWP